MSHLKWYTVVLALILAGCGLQKDEFEARQNTGGETNTPTGDSSGQLPDEQREPDNPEAGTDPAGRPHVVDDRPDVVKPDPPPAKPETHVLTLGAYNLLRLGSNQGKDLTRMAALALAADYDVFGAVEIMEKAAAEELLAEMRRISGDDWQMLISKEAAGEYIYREHFAFYYRADRLQPANTEQQFCMSKYAELSSINSCYAQDTRKDRKPDFEREPYIGHFTMGEKLITIVSVHVYFGDWSDEAVSRRRHEMSGLLRVVDEIEESTPNTEIFVVGDFNLEIMDDESGLDETVPHWFYDDLVGLIDGPTTTGYSNYDHIFYHGKNTVDLIVGSDTTVLDFPIWDRDERYEYKREVSDHYPVKAQFTWETR